MHLARRAARAVDALRAYIARRLSSPKDLSHYDIALGRRPNWSSRHRSYETQPCCEQAPMFAPSRSRYARVSEGLEGSEGSGASEEAA